MLARILLLFPVCVAFLALRAAADNPPIPNQGVCDGHVHLFNDEAYLFTSHDFDPRAKGWELHDWQLFSSTDLVHWNKKFVLKPEDTFIGKPSTHCYATDGATRGGKYFFYFSDGQASTGVARADAPDGPYVDALRHPMVSSYDPTPFIDDDAGQTPYFVWGAVHFKIARLNEDMTTLAEPERTIELLDWQDVHDGASCTRKTECTISRTNAATTGPVPTCTDRTSTWAGSARWVRASTSIIRRFSVGTGRIISSATNLTPAPTTGTSA